MARRVRASCIQLREASAGGAMDVFKETEIDMNAYQKVYVICPGDALTAGPEALHQLAADLIRLGQPAAMVYLPSTRKFSTPGPYEKYNVPVEDLKDELGCLIIFPEIFTVLALKIKNATAAIWWLSVNNYTCLRYGNPLRDRFRYLKNLIKGKRPLLGISSLKKLRHFAQSNYATEFLLGRGIESVPLSDPIPVYTEINYISGLSEKIIVAERTNVILYNPTKGAKVTAKLKTAFPDWDFRPLRGLDRQQLAEAFLTAKIYMDFGHHPGKDRLPREAALHGCCVITSRYGSAENPLDVPIPARYKMDCRAIGFVGEFRLVVESIFTEFETCSLDFDFYREVIQKEQIAFDEQIKTAFYLV